MKLTFLSDTHGKHNRLTPLIKGGDAIFHTGDISTMGYMSEIEQFLNWFDNLNYKYKILIAGNHDFGFMDYPLKIKNLLTKYNVIYLEDDFTYIGEQPNLIKVYGTPWQPMFNDWAFNLNDDELKEKLLHIHKDTDILLTHNPPAGILDNKIGCKKLLKITNQIKPKIHAFGHNHQNKGIKTINDIHFINCTILNNKNLFTKYPINIYWNKTTNEIEPF